MAQDKAHPSSPLPNEGYFPPRRDGAGDDVIDKTYEVLRKYIVRSLCSGLALPYSP